LSDSYLNDALKQRLVGAGVLLILACLLWPILFDFDDTLELDAPPSEIPAMPTIEKVQVEPPKPKAQIKSTAKLEPSSKASSTASDGKANSLEALISDAPKPPPVAGKSSNSISESQRPRLDDQGVPVSFVVQVGTFKNWSNADALRNKLIKNGQKAYTTPAVSALPGPYTVLIGPVLTYDKAQKAVADVKRQTSIKDAIIKRFRSVQ